MRGPWTGLERAGVLAGAVIIAVVLIAVVAGPLGHRDPSDVDAASSVGQSFRDQGDARLAAGALRPRYDSQPPTSGPHHRAPVRRDGVPLSDDSLLTALAAGDVVVFYGHRQPPAGLAALAARLAGPFTAALSADGQAVVLARRGHMTGLIAVAWTRRVVVGGPGDPLLAQFIRAWLGRGAGTR